jgi:cytochrome c-type biogenesis protein CcsB
MTAQHYLLFTLGLYAVGALDMLVQAISRRRLLTSWTVAATLIGFALHTASLSQRWRDAGHFPVVGLHDGASILAWAIVLVFLVVYVRARVEALGLVAYPVAFALVLIANLTPAAESGNPILRSLFLPIHAALAVGGYAALFLAFAMGVLYLIQEHELKARSPRAFYYMVPSLETCDTISGRSVAVGFSFLTLAIVTGMLWSYSAHGLYWTGDAKEWAALAGWILYVVLLVARLRTGWGGRRAALLGIAGFSAVVFTFVWMTVFAGSAGAVQ